MPIIKRKGDINMNIYLTKKQQETLKQILKFEQVNVFRKIVTKDYFKNIDIILMKLTKEK